VRRANAPAAGPAALAALLTDFGTDDVYVGVMKAVLLGICPPAQVIDLTHAIPPQDVLLGALALADAAPYLPEGAVAVAVVDPGVGSARAALAARAGGRYFVGPDNGLLSWCLAADAEVVRLEEPRYRLPRVSRTFHGRDLFAPAAAHVASGLDLARLGPPVGDPVRLAWPEVRAVAGAVAGAVVHADRFGNLITSIHARTLAPVDADLVIRVGGREVPLVGTYGDLSIGRPGALIGSSGRLEIAVREGSAATLLRARRGTAVVVSRPSARRAPRRRR